MKKHISFRKKKYYEVFCSVCGEILITSEDCFLVYPSLKEAKERCNEEGWKVRGNNAICDSCYVFPREKRLLKS